MGAFNWINVEARCPFCRDVVRLRCQTHVASDHAGDATGRFHDRDYELGQPMAWWPREHERFDAWRGGRWRAEERAPGFDQEACYATCTCGAELYVVVRFRENVPERVVAVGKEADWPDEYLK
ncbi:MAG TPA: hypothetical protein VM734_20480 [Kofleriaceae bacterium]|nr:hypothetical protein [Kofleriaceae bacterium]